VKKLVTFGLLVLFLSIAQITIARPLMVFVSIVPQKYFLEKIGGDLVEVAVMVQPGASPATYEPKPRQMVALAKADIYFAIGVPFEATWLKKISATNTKMVVVHTEAGIQKVAMITHHQHEEEAEQHQGKTGQRHVRHLSKDPHIWLSPPLVMQQARNILNGLVALDKAHRPIYEANYRNFIVEIVDLDLELKRTFETDEDHLEFMVFHPSWGYFARAYGLKQIPIEMEGKEPKPAELQYLIQYGREHGIKAIFVQPQFSWQAAQTIAHSLGGQIILVDPLAPDWKKNLQEVAVKFQTALR